MCLSIASLNSGSNGNCYYVGNGSEAILIDAGLSGRETGRRMKRLGLSPSKLRAIFITHEHSDHIKGVRSLIKKYKLPVYMTTKTLEYGRVKIKDSYLRHFNPLVPVTIGTLSIIAFPKFHDACDPHSFVVSCNRVNVGIFTDIGSPCRNLIYHFKQCHAAFLESNYDEKMLDEGTYPYALKNRIRGGRGHLSNKQALQLFMEYRPVHMTHLLLSHLSENNNRPEIVQNLFNRCAGQTHIAIASRYHESPVYEIQSNGLTARAFKTAIRSANIQLSLFQ